MKIHADISYTVLECYLQENWAQDASWITVMLTLIGNLQQIPPPNRKLNVCGSGWLVCPEDLFENNRKVTPSAGCRFLFVCFLMVGTYCNWGLRVYNKQCQPLGHNNRPVWNPENYTLALSSIIGFSTAPVQNCSAK